MKLIVAIKKKLNHYTLDVNLSHEEDFCGLFGGSGSGKSMILKCIAGLEEADEGYIEWNNKVLFDSVKGINVRPQDRKIAYLSQSYGLFPNMTVVDNIQIVMSRRKKDRIDNRHKVGALVKQFRLVGLETRYPHQLSGGQQQRVALARICAYQPELLLLDEPFSALDAYLKEEVYEEFRILMKEFTANTMIISHDKDEIYQFSNQLYVLNDGRIVEGGRTKEIFEEPTSIVTAKLLSYKNIWRKDESRYYGVKATDIIYVRSEDSIEVADIDEEVKCLDEKSFVKFILGDTRIEESSLYQVALWAKIDNIVEYSNRYEIVLKVVRCKKDYGIGWNDSPLHWNIYKGEGNRIIDTLRNKTYHYFVVNKIIHLE